MQSEPVEIRCRDGVAIRGRWWRCDSVPKGSLLVAGALGVPQRFYRHFAAALSKAGWQVLTFDYRGTGESRVPDRVLARTDLLVWGEQDLDAALRELEAEGRGRPIAFLGHSMGSQLVGMSEVCMKLKACVFIGSSLPHWRRWPMLPGLGLLFLWYLLIPLAALGRKHFPARLLRLGSENVPAAAMRQWARWCKDRDYLFAPRFAVDTHRYGEMCCPILSMHFSDDGYASAEACRALLTRFPNAQTELQELAPADVGTERVGHFGYFRAQLGDTPWRRVSDWLTAATCSSDSLVRKD